MRPQQPTGPLRNKLKKAAQEKGETIGTVSLTQNSTAAYILEMRPGDVGEQPGATCASACGPAHDANADTAMLALVLCDPVGPWSKWKDMVCHSWDMWCQHAKRVVAYGDKLRLDPLQGSWVDQRAPRPGASYPDGPTSVARCVMPQWPGQRARSI